MSTVNLQVATPAPGATPARPNAAYLLALGTDMQRVLAHIERELATRAAAAGRDPSVAPTAQPHN